MQYNKAQEGKKSCMTTYRIQELESLGFKWSFEWESPASNATVISTHSATSSKTTSSTVSMASRQQRKRRLESQVLATIRSKLPSKNE
jgi:hypothetical protein